MKNKGKVYLVGAGPGSPDLITLKGIRCLEQAEAVIYDRLVNPRLLGYVPQGAEIIYAGKSSHKHTIKQDEINRLLVKKAKQGKVVIRLKCGDPFLFARGAEEALFLAKHKITFEVVPGVSSATAVPAYAGIPLTHRDYTSSVGIFTGHEQPAKEGSHKPPRRRRGASRSHIYREKIARGLGTLVFLMGVENLSRLVKNLLAAGRPKDTPCCLIQAGTYPEQKSLTADLAAISEKAKRAGFRPPAILVVGEVVDLRKKINWFELKPLFGKRILLTRPAFGMAEGENSLSELLEGQGAFCVEFPVLAIKPLDDYRALDASIKQIMDFHWLIFTSQNGVKFFKQRLVHLRKDARSLSGVKIAAIGPRTKMALEAIGLRADLEPAHYCQEGLIECFKKIKIKGQNILIIRALSARDALPQGLEKMGARIKITPAYQASGPKPQATSLRPQVLDVITFTSSSSVRNFFQILSKKVFRRLTLPFLSSKNLSPLERAGLIKKPLLASIGPITSGQLKRLGLKPDIEAKSYTFEGLTQAIVQYYQR